MACRISTPIPLRSELGASDQAAKAGGCILAKTAELGLGKRFPPGIALFLAPVAPIADDLRGARRKIARGSEHPHALGRLIAKMAFRRKRPHVRHRDKQRTARPEIPAPPGAAQPVFAQGLSRPDARRAQEPPQRGLDRVRRLPRLCARRRPALHRLEHIRAPGAPVPEAVSRRAGPVFLRAARCQPVDGLRRGEQAGLCQARRGRAVLHRLEPSGQSRPDRLFRPGDARLQPPPPAGIMSGGCSNF